MLKQVGNLIGLTAHAYRSAAIGAAPASAPAATLLNGRPGTRLPHLWLDAAKQASTLDWLRGKFILVATESVPK